MAKTVRITGSVKSNKYSYENETAYLNGNLKNGYYNKTETTREQKNKYHTKYRTKKKHYKTKKTK